MRQDIRKSGYTASFDDASGKWVGLYDTFNPEANWIPEEEEHGFCAPFMHGTQNGEDDIPLSYVYKDSVLEGTSPWKGTHNKILFQEDRICIFYNTVPDNGPRAGLHMNLNLLDLPTSGTVREQCMPKIIYVDENYQYAYFVFATGDHRYMILTVSSPFAAWRIHYSYEGHRMTGFQILTQADDVLTDGRGALPICSSLEIQIQFADTLMECYKKISETLEAAIAVPKITGGFSGGRIPFSVMGDYREIQIQSPSGKIREYSPSKEQVLLLEENGIYQLLVTSLNGRRHISRVLCHEDWETQFERINHFYKEHFQDETGAFYRIISSETLLPDKENFEGGSFGNPYLHHSCRTGEFGGFAAWAMIKNELTFGEKPELREAVKRYLFDWALNRGHEDTPYFGTVYKKPNQFLGREYGPYHLYEEMNYLQHEIFLLEEMADYYLLTGDKSIREDALGLLDHVAAEHVEEDGTVVNQNFADKPGVDYSTVHTSMCGFLRWAEILKREDPKKSEELYKLSEKIADHVCKRGIDFPTEGEPCTEDGSMGGTIATLLYAYMRIKPKPEYLKTAKDILNLHHVLEMDGSDCRMRNSTIRFWETQYETREWGPSINAGHAWTIWTAEAKAALAVIEKDFKLLQEAYEGFVTNMCKVDRNGGMFCCYTPDMIPGTPHAHILNVPLDHADEHNDMRPTSTHLGMDFPKKAYAASGNYYLIKAAEIWSHISGLNLDGGVSVNGVYDGRIFRSGAVHLDQLFLFGETVDFYNAVHIKTQAGQKIQILSNQRGLIFEEADLMEQEEGLYTICCRKNMISVRIPH